MSHDERLTDIEAKIAHQEQAIQTLGDELFRQQKTLTKLESTCNFLIEQLRAQADPAPAAHTDDEKPPHY